MTAGDGLSRDERVEVIQQYVDWGEDFYLAHGVKPSLDRYEEHLELEELRRKAANV